MCAYGCLYPGEVISDVWLAVTATERFPRAPAGRIIDKNTLLLLNPDVWSLNWSGWEEKSRETVDHFLYPFVSLFFAFSFLQVIIMLY